MPPLRVSTEKLFEADGGANLRKVPWLMTSGALAVEGWDSTRAIVMSLGEIPYEGPPGAIVPQLPIADDWLPPLRHQLWVPATDPAKLTRSFESMLLRASSVTSHPEIVAAHEGAVALELPDVLIAILPENDAVRVVAFHEAEGMHAAALHEYAREHLDTANAPLPSTPAARVLTRADASTAILVRPWRARALVPWFGAAESIRAQSRVAADQHALAVAKGTAILLDAELRMGDQGAEIDDIALAAVSNKDAIRIHGAASLTPQGAAIFDANEAQRLDAPVYSLDAGEHPWAQLTAHANFTAMRDVAKAPPARVNGEAPFEFVRVLAQDRMLVGYLIARYPFGMLRMLDELASHAIVPVSLERLPIAAHLLWSGSSDGAPQGVFALQWPEDVDAKRIIDAINAGRRAAGVAPLGTPETVEGEQLTLFGDARTSVTFGSPALSQDVLARGSVSTSKLIEHFVPASAAANFKAMARGGDAQIVVRRRSRSIELEAAVSKDGGEVSLVEGERQEPEDFSWSSPLGSPRGGEGARCLVDAGHHARRGLDVLASTPREQLASIVSNTINDTERALACADGDAATADAARALRRMLALRSADVLIEAEQANVAHELLRTQCELHGETEVCARASRLTGGGGALDKEAIRGVVRSRIEEIRSCYNTGLKQDPSLSGRVVIRFTINGLGFVTSAMIESSTIAMPEVERCIADATGAWKFPSPKGGRHVIVSYPFVLQPG